MRWSARSGPVLVSGMLATGTALVVLGIACRGGRRSRLVDPVLRAWAWAWLAPAGVRLVVQGREHLADGQAYIVVSNHQSNLDPIVHVAGLGVPVRFLAMRELFTIPVFGTALRWIGMIEVDRSEPDLGTIEAGVSRALRDGMSVVVYPEGGTSGDGTLGPFHGGAFRLAAANGAPILPTVLTGTNRVWKPGSNAIRGGVVRLVIGPPIATEGLAPDDIERVREQVREWIEAGCLRRDAASA